TLMLCGTVGVLVFGSAAFTSCYHAPPYTPPPPPPPNSPAYVRADFGEPCTASDPVNGEVQGSEVRYIWTPPAAGSTPTGYLVTMGGTLRGQRETTPRLPPFAADETSPAWTCLPIGTRIGASVAAFNDTGASWARPADSGAPMVPPTGLAWTTPAS